jgi:hypothetical protein
VAFCVSRSVTFHVQGSRDVCGALLGRVAWEERVEVLLATYLVGGECVKEVDDVARKKSVLGGRKCEVEVGIGFHLEVGSGMMRRILGHTGWTAT